MSRRTRVAAIFLAGALFQGCGARDPGQPGVGTISVKSKSERHDDAPPSEGRAAKFLNLIQTDRVLRAIELPGAAGR